MRYSEFKETCCRKSSCNLQENKECPDTPCLMFEKLSDDCREESRVEEEQT